MAKRRKRLLQVASRRQGRVFGVPGFLPGQPGWAGNASIAQSPHPTRVIRLPDTRFVSQYTVNLDRFANFGDHGTPEWMIVGKVATSRAQTSDIQTYGSTEIIYG